MEQFYHPRLTDWFAFTYMNYYFMTLMLLAILNRKRRYREFRILMLTMMISYFIGFVSYIIFPASSPYLVISRLYHTDIWKDTSFISSFTRSIVDMAPHRVRAEFRSAERRRRRLGRGARTRSARTVRTEFNPQTGEMKVWRPDGGPLELEDVEGPGMALMVVKDRGGKILAPPIAYKGKRLEDRTPAGVAKIALDHASAMIHEAEALSKPSP